MPSSARRAMGKDEVQPLFLKLIDTFVTVYDVPGK
jgi:hypothetical protein